MSLLRRFFVTDPVEQIALRDGGLSGAPIGLIGHPRGVTHVVGKVDRQEGRAPAFDCNTSRTRDTAFAKIRARVAGTAMASELLRDR